MNKYKHGLLAYTDDLNEAGLGGIANSDTEAVMLTPSELKQVQKLFKSEGRPHPITGVRSFYGAGEGDVGGGGGDASGGGSSGSGGGGGEGAPGDSSAESTDGNPGDGIGDFGGDGFGPGNMGSAANQAAVEAMGVTGSTAATTAEEAEEATTSTPGFSRGSRAQALANMAPPGKSRDQAIEDAAIDFGKEMLSNPTVTGFFSNALDLGKAISQANQSFETGLDNPGQDVTGLGMGLAEEAGETGSTGGEYGGGGEDGWNPDEDYPSLLGTTTTQPPPSVNTPIDPTRPAMNPWDFQLQRWRGNAFTPQPLRRLT